MSFVLCIFDNIVGPKIVHHWTTERQLEDHLLKYIAIHTLNGELYQDQLVSQHKYRLYLIKEVELAVFSIFFDASTIQTCSYGQQQNTGYERGSSTCLNCFSLVVPLKNKKILFDHYGDNTKFFINSFENMILEYKVFAEIKPKIDKVTTAIGNLTSSINTFCSSLNLLRIRGIYPVNSENELKIPHKIHVMLSEFYFK